MASKEQAEALAAKLQGRSGDSDVLDMLVGGVKTGKHPNAAREPGDGKAENLAEVDDDLGDDLTDDDDDQIEDEIPDDPDDAEAVEVEDDDEGGDALEDADEDANEQDENLNEVYYSDDDIVEVTVDGELREVTLSDLKKAYSGEGAIEKRLKEATELRKSAQSEADRSARAIEDERATFYRTVEKYIDVLTAPIIAPPSAELRRTNRDEYLIQKEAYDEDQLRIQQLRQGLGQAIGQEIQKDSEARALRKQRETALLVEKIPALRDPEKAKRVHADILEAAAEYGFTPNDVATVEHHGLIMMALDAARWRKLQKQKKSGGKETVPTGGDKKTAPRKLKAGGAGSVLQRKMAAQKSGKEAREAEARARKTGNPTDVAAMLVAKATKQSGGRRGR